MHRQIEEFDRAGAQMFRDHLNEELKALGRKMGMEFAATNLRITNRRTITAALTVSLDEVDMKDTPSGRAFCAYGPGYGFKPDHLGVTFRHKNTIYRITGWCTRSHKYRLLTENVATGGVMRFEPGYARALLAA